MGERKGSASYTEQPPRFPCRPHGAILRECTREPVVGLTFNLLTESLITEEETSYPYLIPRPGITDGDNGNKNDEYLLALL